MRRALIDSRHPTWRNALGVLAALLIVPIAILIKIIIMPFERPIKRSPDEVARYIRDFVEGTGDDGDFDDFTSIPISDHRLDEIRKRAARVSLPITQGGIATLKQLLAEAEALADSNRHK